MMSRDAEAKLDACNCLAVRRASRHVTQFYDRILASIGLRTTQFSVLAKLEEKRPMTINVLAKYLVMDRTALGRNILPLEREGLIAVAHKNSDRRCKELRLTNAGARRRRAAVRAWTQAQAQFETVFGDKRTLELRFLLHAVASSDFSAGGAPVIR